MAAYCQPLTYESGFVTGMLNFIDCQAQNLGSQGYQALAAPGSMLSLLLTGMLTLFVAFHGYRMLFGQTPTPRDGVMALAKIGIVLALATSWPAYRTLFYDVALRGPAEIAASVGAPAGLPGSNGGIVSRLQGLDAGLIALDKAGVGDISQQEKRQETRIINGRPETVIVPVRDEADGFQTWAINAARVFYLVTAIAGFAVVRLVAGLLLALGPFFIAFLLFDGTRGLFEGWIRGLAAAALGAVGVTLLLGMQLALMEPWISELLARRAARLAIVGAPTEIMVVTLVFALTLLTMLTAVTRLAMGFRMPASIRAASAQLVESLRGEQSAQRPAFTVHQAPAEQRSRAAAVAEAVAAAQRREAAQVTVNAAQRQASATGLARDLPPPAQVPLGQSYSRRTRNRASGSAGKRDSTS